MRGPRTIRGAARLGAACLVVMTVACGGGGSNGVTKAEYLAQASRVCQEGNQTLTAASNEVFAKVPRGQKLPEPEIEAFVRGTVIPTIRDQITRLRALPKPVGKQGRVEEIYAALDRGVGELEKNPGKLADGSNVFGEADTLAKKYGIKVCATTG